MKELQFIFALVLVGAVGCSDSGSGGTSKTVTVELRVVTFSPGETDVPLEGAAVCVLESTNCQTSDSDGMVSFEMPANSETGFNVVSEGYTPTLAPLTTGEEDLSRQTAVLADAVVEAMAAILDTPYPLEGDGVVAVSILTAPVVAPENGIAGATLTSGEAYDTFYLDENEFPSYELTATTAPSGVGGVVELPPGTHAMELGGEISNCVIDSGWAGSTPSSLRLPVEAGFFTQAFVSCDEGAP